MYTKPPVRMNIVMGCGSCAVRDITNLGNHKDAVHAMKNFCLSELGVVNAFTNAYMLMTPFYIFCAGPEVPATAPGGSHHSKDWVRYGTEFAQFITDNGLGEVATVSPKKNLKNHPNSTAQVWAWSPDQKAVEEWWNANGGRDPNVGA